jgi:hypothetical protein
MHTTRLWIMFTTRLRLLRDDERGDVVNWLIVTLGVAVAATAVIVVLRPAIESAGQQIANLLSGA